MLSLTDEKKTSKTTDIRVKRLISILNKTIYDYNLIEKNDRIMVAVSGGKDSIGLLFLLLKLQKKIPFPFSIFAYTLDQAQPGFDATLLENLYKQLGIEYYIEREDTYSVVLDKVEEGKTYCSLCSRLRRGILYAKKKKFGATKLALGHHADDAFETLVLNMLYSGRLAAISPKLLSDDGQNIVIRPLIKVDEKEMTWLSEEYNFPIIPCNLCSNQENLQRKRIKEWIQKEEKYNPVIRGSLKSALGKIEPRHLW